MSSIDRSTIKRQAMLLRKYGKSYAEITTKLGVPKSTLSDWLKDVPFSEKIKEANIHKTKQIWAKSIREYNAKRHEIYVKQTEDLVAQYASEVSDLSPRDLFFLVMGIFWGEGSKCEPWIVKISNADPKLIQVSMRFFREYCNISNDKFYGRVHAHPNISPEVAKQYWADITHISINRIGVQTVISRASKGKRLSRKLPYGTFHLMVNSSSFTKKMKGWFRGVITKSITPE